MDNLLANFNCPICIEPCVDAVECMSCHNIFCEPCTKKLQPTNSLSSSSSSCPICRSNEPRYTVSHIARRLINLLPVQCSYCQEQMTRQNLKGHEAICPKLPITCSICSLSMEKDKCFSHLLADHTMEIQNNLSIILRMLDPTQHSNTSLTSFNSSGHQSTHSINSTLSIQQQTNPRNNRTSRLGETGKYYCGEEFTEHNCICCDGYCGLLSGCNCVGCMELDIKHRGLPSGWLVNREGYNAVRSVSNGRFYCGRRVMEDVENCDGYCGPNNGPQCMSCEYLNQQIQNRYKILINNEE